jgi:hypothetical protein
VRPPRELGRYAFRDSMKRYFHQLVLASAAILTIGCGSAKSLPPLADEALKNGTEFELLSLDPDPDAEKTGSREFCGWKVLGSTVIKDSDTRAELIASIKAGVAENTGTVADCFYPRHGIKVTINGEIHEFVICFQCYQVNWNVDGNYKERFLITDSPQPTFDRILKDANVPLAKDFR